MSIRGKAFIAGAYEDPRRVVGCAPDEVLVGQAVELTFHDTGQGNALPRFRPARREEDDG
jgi:hypothetical protein